MSKHQVVPWVLAAGLGATAAFSLLRPERVSIKEVPVEVIREVPKEVVREVTKEVERKLTEEEQASLRLGERLVRARTLDGDSKMTLRGWRAVNVVIDIAEPLRESLDPERIRVATELAARQVGLVVEAEPKHPVLNVSVDGRFFDEATLTYSMEVAAYGVAILPCEPQWVIQGTAKVYSVSSYGRVGRSKVGNLESSVADSVRVFLNDYLAANPPESRK